MDSQEFLQNTLPHLKYNPNEVLRRLEKHLKSYDQKWYESTVQKPKPTVEDIAVLLPLFLSASTHQDLTVSDIWAEGVAQEMASRLVAAGREGVQALSEAITPDLPIYVLLGFRSGLLQTASRMSPGSYAEAIVDLVESSPPLRHAMPSNSKSISELTQALFPGAPENGVSTRIARLALSTVNPSASKNASWCYRMLIESVRDHLAQRLFWIDQAALAVVIDPSAWPDKVGLSPKSLLEAAIERLVQNGPIAVSGKDPEWCRDSLRILLSRTPTEIAATLPSSVEPEDLDLPNADISNFDILEAMDRLLPFLPADAASAMANNPNMHGRVNADALLLSGALQNESAKHSAAPRI